MAPMPVCAIVDSRQPNLLNSTGAIDRNRKPPGTSSNKYPCAIDPTAPRFLNLNIIQDNKYIALNQLMKETEPRQKVWLVNSYQHELLELSLLILRSCPIKPSGVSHLIAPTQSCLTNRHDMRSDSLALILQCCPNSLVGRLWHSQ